MISSKITTTLTGWQVFVFVDKQEIAHKFFESKDVADSFCRIVDNSTKVSCISGRLVFEK